MISQEVFSTKTHIRLPQHNLQCIMYQIPNTLQENLETEVTA